ncbi:MAG: alanine--tRNA ligase, partial [Gemmatimonadota bacterium]|nr:alanine--tRNA ligase [Gemmatimonadota bacterium]
EMRVAFPEVAEKRDHITRVIRAEEEGFGKTLDRGLEIFEAMQAKGHISGADAFQLYDTYGFPIDLTRLMAAEQGIEVDEEGFEAQMAEQQKRSRLAASFHIQAEVSEVTHIPKSKFVGYETLTSDSRIVGQSEQNGMLDLYLDITPFYAESGGQVGDTGEIVGEGVRFEVATTFKAGEAIVHRGRLCNGQVEELKGMDVKARVDAETRLNTARNHTATHLMHRALRQVLGDHVHQAGSLVAPDRLRFDFTHFEGVTPAQLDDIVGIVNDAVRRDWAVDISFDSFDRAVEMGAMMLFSEKYGDEVRMVQVGDFSLELCGGTHVQSTGQIGLFQLTQETGTAAGVRRIEAVTGPGAEALVREQKKILVDLSSQLSASTSELSDKVAHLIAHNRELERELQSLRRERAGSEMDMLVSSALNVNGLRVVAAEVSPPDMDGFRTMGDGLRDALGTGGVGVIGANLNGKASLLAVVTDDLIDRGVQAGNVVKAIAQIVGGGGGGRPHLAQAGGKFPEKIGEALAQVPDIIRAQVGG